MKNLFEELLRIKELSGFPIKENKEISDWNTLYTWIKLFSTDDGQLLRSNNITSGIWLKNSIENGEITPTKIDSVTRLSDGVKFSELPLVKKLIK